MKNLIEKVLLFKLVYVGKEGKLFLSAMAHHNNEGSACKLAVTGCPVYPCALIVWSFYLISAQFTLAVTAKPSDLHS